MLKGPPLFSVSMGGPVQPNSIAARTAEEARQNWPMDTVKVWNLPQATKKTVFVASQCKYVVISYRTLYQYYSRF